MFSNKTETSSDTMQGHSLSQLSRIEIETGVTQVKLFLV